MKIIYEDNHLLVVEKPCNIPMQADSSKDKDLLTMGKEYLKEKYNKPGNVYLGLVHRLDRPVGGVCVMAKTSKAAARLSRMVAAKDVFHKEYLALVEYNGLPAEGHLCDKLLKDQKTNTVRVDEKGKEAVLDYRVLDIKDNIALVRIDLKTGRSHQIRVQFASRGHALINDQRYNKNAVKRKQICLHASCLSFPHPATGETMTFISEAEFAQKGKICLK